MRAVLVATWSGVRAGRQAALAEYMLEIDDYWSGPAAEGLCSELTWWRAGDGRTHWFVEGDAGDLVLLSSTTRAQWLTLKGSFVAQRFEEHIYLTGSHMRPRRMERLLRERHLV